MEKYVIIWCKLAESAIFKDAKLLQVFIWCLLKAVPKEQECNKMMLTTGQFFTGQHVASVELNMSASMYRRKLLILKELSVVTTKVVKNFTLITICKYETYQKRSTEQPASNIKIDYKKAVVKAKSKKPKHQETTPLIIYFCNKYKETLNKTYIPSYARDGASIKRLLDGGLTFDTLIKAMDRYLADTNSWLMDKGHTISFFASRINQYAIITENQPDHLELEIRD